MGSSSEEFARSVGVLLSGSYSIICKMRDVKMTSALLFLLLLVSYMCQEVAARPFDLSYGGVFDSAAANAYWARRFPDLIQRAPNLKLLQEAVDREVAARITP